MAYLISALSDNNIAVSKAMSMLSRDKSTTYSRTGIITMEFINLIVSLAELVDALLGVM